MRGNAWRKIQQEKAHRKALADDRVMANMLAWLRYLDSSMDNLKVYRLSEKQRKLLPRRLKNMRKELTKVRDALEHLC